MDYKKLQHRLLNLVVWLLIFDCLNADLDTEYFPSDVDTASLEVNLEFNSPFFTRICIRCRNYDSLKFLEIRPIHWEQFTESNGLRIEFFDCFNNATDNHNYNFSLMSVLTNLTNFKPTKKWNHLRISLDQYAIVNSDVLLKQFNFHRFRDVSFSKVGFKSTEFLNQLNCQGCVFEFNHVVNFNNFNTDLNTTELTLQSNKLLNINKSNLQKFSSIRRLKITYFELDDYNTFNVPELFEHNSALHEISIEDSKEKITLHERVFAGLNYLIQLTLQDLKLDHIPKDLFKDLTRLRSLYLSSNNIKRIEPTSLENNSRLTFATFTDNPIFTEPQVGIDHFKLGDSTVELFMGNFTVHTLNILEQFVKNPKVRRVLFQSILINPINLNEFTKFQTNRKRPLDVKFLGDDVTLDLEYARSIGINIKSEDEIESSRLSVVIRLPIADGTFCTDCTILKQIFPRYLNNYRKPPGLYFEESRVLVIPNIQDSCHHLEEFFDNEFIENCPANCNCKYSPLLDKIKINCNNKNLTEIPIIPYPVQFNKIHSIELHFDNNSLRILSFASQDQNVLQKLSTVFVRNNKIESVVMDAKQSQYIQVFDLCDNPIVAGNRTVKIEGIETYNDVFDEYVCRVGSSYPYPQEYMQSEEKAEQLKGLLNDLKCN